MLPELADQYLMHFRQSRFSRCRTISNDTASLYYRDNVVGVKARLCRYDLGTTSCARAKYQPAAHRAGNSLFPYCHNRVRETRHEVQCVLSSRAADVIWKISARPGPEGRAGVGFRSDVGP